MTTHRGIRRTALFGLALGVAACDVVEFVQDPKPRLVQTWNFPASDATISVAKLLPSGVSIYSTPASTPPDSSGFAITVNPTNISRVVGADCAQCVTLNGTNAPKPQFVLAANNAASLPANVVSAALQAGQVQIALTNNMSFDPLYVNTAPAATTQGYMVILVRSCTAGGAILLGKDSVRGAATTLGPNDAPFPKNGGVLNRTISLATGTLSATCPSGQAGGVTVDVTVNSPLGDHSEFINANGALNATASVTGLVVGNVSINVPVTSITPGTPTDLPDDLDKSITDHVISGALEMSITNPFAVAGNLNAQFAYGVGQTVTKGFALPSATATPQVRVVSFDSTEMVNIFSGKPTRLTMTGSVSSVAPILVTPKQQVSISNRLVLKVRQGGGS